MTGRCRECGRIATCFVRNPVTNVIEEYCVICCDGLDEEQNDWAEVDA
jgi:hypothetical protein